MRRLFCRSLTSNLKQSASITALALGAALTAAPASAQSQNPADDMGVEEITVRGINLSRLRATELKRGSDAILDAVSADDLGKLPDKNASEAIDRLPGVSISIDQGEGRFVSIRGAGAELNSVTINGLNVGSVEPNSRAIPLDIIGGELLGGIEVIKAVTPDLEANAVGGAINVTTVSAFDFENDIFGSVSGQIGDESYSSTTPWAVDGLIGGKFGPDQTWGIILGASYSYRDYQTKGLYVDDWREVDGLSRSIPESHKFNRYGLERERLGFTGSLEYKPDDDTLFYARALWTKFDEFEVRHRGRNYFSREEGAPELIITSPTTGTFEDQRLRTELRVEEKDKRIGNYSFGGEFKPTDRLKAEIGGSIIDNNNTEPNAAWRFQGNNITAGTFDMSDRVFTVTAFSGVIDSQLDELEFVQYTEQDDVIDDDGWQVKGDLTYDAPTEFDLTLKTGFVYRSIEKTQDINDFTWEDGSNDFGLDTAGLVDGTIEGTLPGGQHYLAGPRLSIDGIRSFTDANINDATIFVPQPGDDAVDAVSNDYVVEEDVLAAYLMGTLDFDVWRIIAGARLEHTKVDTSGFQIINGGDEIIPVTDSGKYTHVLPAVHIQYRPQDMPFIARFAYTNTIGRPEFSDIAPRQSVSFELEDDTVPGVFLGGINQGNPDLEAFESLNLDLSFEYYLDQGGIISVAGFYKEVDGFIVDQSIEQTGITFGGRTYSEFTTTTPINANKGEILGVEFNYQQQLSFLPGLFSGLGLGASFTLVDSEIEIDGRDEKLPFVRQADTLYSLLLFYQWEGLEASLSYDWADDILVDVGGNADNDFYDDDYGRLDFKASYQINDNYGVFLELQNLNNEVLGEYQSTSDQITRQEYYGITGYIGATVRF